MSAEKHRPFLPDTPEIARAKKSREEDKRKLKAKLARPKPSPEAVAAMKGLDEEEIDALRRKLAGIEVSIKFPRETGESPFTDTDTEELEDLTCEV